MIGLAGLLAVPATTAWAEDPVTIPSGQNIVDDANVLGGRTGRSPGSHPEALKDHKYNLYVVTVDKFENPTDPAAWAEDVAQEKSMGRAERLILAIATRPGNTTLY